MIFISNVCQVSFQMQKQQLKVLLFCFWLYFAYQISFVDIKGNLFLKSKLSSFLECYQNTKQVYTSPYL